MKVMLAHKYEGTDPTGWWMSEKLDGVRAIWDGENFRSRNGNIFQAPNWFKEKMPNVMLDGELWLGRGKFQQVVGIVKSHLGNSSWLDVKYMVFDLVDELLLCEQRQAVIKVLVLPAHVSVLKQIKCFDQTRLNYFHHSILELGGEGVMLRAPNSLYEHKRSKLLLKVKQMKTARLRVQGYQPGKGKYEGMTGALLCEWYSYSTSFVVSVGSGLSDAQRANPPAIGSMIEIKHFDVTDSRVPRFPVFVKEIKDEA